jgi:phosphinothricin acetyltransferase
MNQHCEIRLITDSDAEAVLDVYKPFVTDTNITFEYEVPSIHEYRQRIASYTPDFPWLVSALDGKIIGFAYAGKHRDRTAYQWAAESTIYLSPEAQGKGIARVLYETLFSLLRLQGYFNVYAGVSIPNYKSVGFHLALGFDEIGIFRKIGYKHGNWHDTVWFQKHLADHIFNPPLPKKIAEVIVEESFQNILMEANKKIML